MNIETLYEMQKALDERIIKEKGLEGQELLPNTVLALQVEIGELANEWRGFKYWSNDREPRTKVEHLVPLCNGYDGNEIVYKNPLLEEYVDCLHFFLSLARQIGVEVVDMQYTDVIYGDVTHLFTLLIHEITSSFYTGSITPFLHAWSAFMDIGERLGFANDQVYQAYIAKNKINHERQSNGY